MRETEIDRQTGNKQVKKQKQTNDQIDKKRYRQKTKRQLGRNGKRQRQINRQTYSYREIQKTGREMNNRRQL